MAGAKYRITSMGEETQYFNVLFAKKQLDKIRKLADESQITRAEVVRRAVEEFLTKHNSLGTKVLKR